MHSLSAWLQYLEALHHQPIELGLDRVRVVAAKLGLLTILKAADAVSVNAASAPDNPEISEEIGWLPAFAGMTTLDHTTLSHIALHQIGCPVITVGGTNGKGSCVTFIASIFKAAGYKTGVYTSPHLLRFNERILIQDTMATDAELMEAFEHIESARGEITLTYFEFTTLAALWLFQESKLDVVILEVGLGGRLDAVNIIDPDVSVITSIALDHMDFLGNTREAIGYEKAGIFRTGKPAICGDPNIPISVLKQANTLNTPLYCVEKDFLFSQNTSTTWDFQSIDITYKDLPIPTLPLQNAATALMAIHCLKDKFDIHKEAIRKGIQNAFLPGRVQHFQLKEMNIWLDVAHNPAAAIYLVKQMQTKIKTGITRAIVGMLSDKDILQTLRPFTSLVDNWYIAGLESVPRGASANIIANYLQQLGVCKYDQHSNVKDAYQHAFSDAKAQDNIIVFGSFHTVGPVLEILQVGT